MNEIYREQEPNPEYELDGIISEYSLDRDFLEGFVGDEKMWAVYGALEDVGLDADKVFEEFGITEPEQERSN